MQELIERIDDYSKQFHKLKTNGTNRNELPGNTYFLEDGSILCTPRIDGDNRFPYGKNGFNFWTYASGYMHANDGLFSPFLRAAEGQEPHIAFFIGFEGKQEKDIVSLLPVPELNEANFDEAVRFTVFTKTCTYYVTEVNQMRFTVRTFVDDNNKIYFTILINNMSSKQQSLFFSPYINPYLGNNLYETSENHWFRKCEYMQKDSLDLGTFVFRVNEDLSRTESVTNLGVLNQAFSMDSGVRLVNAEGTTSRKQYVGGSYSSLHNVKTLKKGTFHPKIHVTSFTDIAVAGEICNLEIPENKSARFDLVLSYKKGSHDPEAFRSLIETIDPNEIEKAISRSMMIMNGENTSLELCLQNGISEEYNSSIATYFFDYLKKQVEFCSLIKGYVQLSLGSLIGIRDVFQALEGMLFYKPESARDKILEALSFISPTGRCPRQYGLPKNPDELPPMDLRQFIDQGSWIINTMITYLKFTGDYQLLKQPCGYYDIIDDKKQLVQKSILKESVLEHLFRIMDYFVQNQDSDTKCIKVLYGDWNDALDGLGVSKKGGLEFGNGVSVMATLHVYQNLREMIDLLRKVKGYEEVVQRYQRIMESVEEGLKSYAVIQNDMGQKRIVHGWGEDRSYFVGSFRDSDDQSRYGLTSNAFWVISGLYQKDTSMGETILQAYRELDSEYGLKTFEPHFLANATGVGRIYKLPPGTAENGATYTHATAFGIMSLFMMGEPKKAWDQLMKILPYTHRYVSCSPYVMPNSYGYNLELGIDGESMQDWQTGSSNVVLKTMIRYVIGFQPEYEGVFIQPASWLPYLDYTFSIYYQGVPIKIQYRNNHIGKRTFHLNGIQQSVIWDEYLKVNKLWIRRDKMKDAIDILIED